MAWDLVDFEEEERVRPAFKGEELYGTYVEGTFIPLEVEPGKPAPPKVIYYPPTERYVKVISRDMHWFDHPFPLLKGNRRFPFNKGNG